MTPYFGADGSNMGTVKSLPVTSFAQFVKEALGHPALLNVTREQYHAMEKADRNALKRVPYFVPATFATSPVSRKIENAVACNLIALDLDEENPAMASVYCRTPAAIGEALRPYAFAAYLTASSLPHKPRMRIIVSADRIPVDRYADAVGMVAKLLGLTTVTGESLVSVQPMYLPTSFVGDDLIGDHPLLASDTEGLAFGVKDIGDPSTLAVPVVKTRGPEDRDGPSVDDLDFLSACLPEVTLEDMESALDSLDPDMPYMEWLEVAAGLRHQFPQQPDEAFDLFDRWSSKGKKYGGDKDTAAKWLSLRPTPRGRKPVTARTLLYRAALAGWSNTKDVSERLYNTIRTWLEDPERTPGELMKDGPRRIAGAPLVSHLERSTLIALLQTRLKAHGLKVSTQDLRREMKRFSSLVFTSPEIAKPTPDAQLPAWARGICYVSGANEFFARLGERKYDPTALNNMFNVHLMTEASKESGRPVMNASEFLLNVARIPRVEHYRYDPGHPEQTFFSENQVRYINTYRPTYPEAMFDGAEEAGAMIEDHMHRLIANRRYGRLLLDWMAYIVQNPGAKVRWAPLLQGAPGCGKTLLARIMEAVLGVGNVRFTEAQLLFENFNGWATGSQLVVLEEVRVHGHNRHMVMNKLKPAISNDDVTIRDLYEKPYQVKNQTNYMLLTNHFDALSLGPDERRYFVLQSSMQTKEQVLALPEDYFIKLFSLVSDKAAQLRAWLLGREISEDFHPHGHAPRTCFLSEMAQAAATPTVALVTEMIDDEIHPLITKDFISAKVAGDHLSNHGLRDVGGQAIAGALRELGFRRCGRNRLADGRHTFWVRRGSDSDANPTRTCQRIIDAHPELIDGQKEQEELV